MTSSRTRKNILYHTFYELLHRVCCFNHTEAEPHSWELLVNSLERAAESLRVQHADYREAREFEEEATRQAEAEYRKEKATTEPETESIF